MRRIGAALLLLGAAPAPGGSALSNIIGLLPLA